LLADNEVKKTIEMKKIWILNSLLMFLCGNAVAQFNVFRSAVIGKHDGTHIACQAKYPNTNNAKEINYRIGNNGRTQKMKSADIQTIRYFLKDDRVIEKVFIPYLNAVEIERGGQKYSEPAWMDVLVRGKMTLYLRTVKQIYSRGRSFTYYYFYCQRENESVATEVACTNFRDGSQFFHNYVHRYFSDHPSIPENIKNNVKGYAANHIEAIVREYNNLLK
jgi:hypothetical protein